MKIGEMVQETGNLDIFEHEPDIFKLDEFSAKDLLVSSLVCELNFSNSTKVQNLFRKLTSVERSARKAEGISQIDKGWWLACFKTVFERTKSLRQLIHLLADVHQTNPEIFRVVVNRKGFQLLKSFFNIKSDLDVSKYVQFDKLFTEREEQDSNINKNSTKVEFSLQGMLQKENKTEIRIGLEHFNVFVIARVLGYFVSFADSLIYYLFAKKLLRKGDSRDQAIEFLQRISSIQFINLQIIKVCEKLVDNSTRLQKQRELILLLGSQHIRLLKQQQKYSVYSSSSFVNSTEKLIKETCESLYIRIARKIKISNEKEEQIQSKNSLSSFFESLLLLDSQNLLDCLECSSLVTEFIRCKIRSVIDICQTSNIEIKVNLREVMDEKIDEVLENACSASVLRKQLSSLLERVQLNMENVQDIIFESLVEIILSQKNNDTPIIINAVIIQLAEALQLSSEQRTKLKQLKMMLKIDLALGKNGTCFYEFIEQQFRGNLEYFIQNYVSQLISGIGNQTTAADIVRFRYIIRTIGIYSLQHLLLVKCSEVLDINVFIIVVSQKLINYDSIDSIINKTHQAIILSVNSFRKGNKRNFAEVVEILEKQSAKFDRKIYAGFVLQFLGAAEFRGNSVLYRDLLEVLMEIASLISSDYPQEDEQQNMEKPWKSESEFNELIEKGKDQYFLCAEHSLKDLIVSNIADLAKEKKYYDSAKLNYRFQGYEENNSSIPLMLQKLKEDVLDMLSVLNVRKLSDSTLFKLKESIPEIRKIH